MSQKISRQIVALGNEFSIPVLTSHSLTTVNAAALDSQESDAIARELTDLWGRFLASSDWIFGSEISGQPSRQTRSNRIFPCRPLSSCFRSLRLERHQYR
jgi:hypothetical protein